MRTDIVGKKNMILDRDVTRERNFVREDVVVTNNAVVGHVDSDHEKVARADAGCQAFAVGPMKSAELANDVVIADFEIARLAFELNILWLAADHSVLENAVACAEASESFDYSVGTDLAIWANFDVILDDGCRMNGHLDRNLQNFTDFQDNRVLWILQILFMM